jgi:outer membrane protein TolC
MKKYLILLLMVVSSILTAINLQESVEVALENNLELKAQEESLKAAKATEASSYIGLGPSASLGMNYNDSDANFDKENFSNVFSLSVRQPIINGGKVILSSLINKDLRKMEEQNLIAKRLEVIAQTENKYFSVLEAKEFMNIAKQNLLSAEDSFKKGQILFEVGSIAQVDLLQLQSDFASKEVSFLQSKNRYELAKESLQNYLQIDEIIEISEVDFSAYEEIIYNLKNIDDIDVLLGKILKISNDNNPTLKISDLSKSTSKKSRLMAVGNFMPTVNLSYNKNWTDSDNLMGMQDYDSSESVGLNISVPIFPIADNGLNLAKANYNLRKTTYSAQNTKEAITLAIKNAFYTLVSNAKMIDSAKLAYEYASESYKQMEERFDNGLIAANDLLAARVMLSSAQTSYATAKYDFLRAQSSILQQLGSENKNILNKLIK